MTLSWTRALTLRRVGIAALASDDPEAAGGKVTVPADEAELRCGRITEVDDHDRVFGEVHFLFEGDPGVGQFGPAEVADEHGVLETVAAFLHRLADPAEPAWVADIVGD
jgi:hypothetical protein